MWVNPTEVNLAGIFFPPLFVPVFFGFVMTSLIVWVINTQGWGYYIWHPPLFFVSLLLLTSSLIALTIN